MEIKITGLSIDDLIHPGETLKEILESYGMTQKELAARINLTEKHISQIICGMRPITVETAIKLETVFSLSATFWNNLQSKYDIEKSEILALNSITEEEYDALKKVPYNDLVKIGLIDHKDKRTERVIQMRVYYQVSNLLNVPKTLETQAYFRKSKYNKSEPYVMAAWCKMCELATDNIEVQNAFNPKLLKTKISEIKSLMFLNAEAFRKELESIMAECGVAFAVVQSIKGAPVNGFTGNINGKMRLCLTLREHKADTFWFSLFHEIGHLFNANKSSKDENESEFMADEFAKHVLIDEEEYKSFLSSCNGIYDRNKIIKFAETQNVLPGTVVGRLQYDGFVNYSAFNDLKIKYEWAKK